jgi:hypothetical protein
MMHGSVSGKLTRWSPESTMAQPGGNNGDLEDKWVIAMQVLSGNGTVVHHMAITEFLAILRLRSR